MDFVPTADTMGRHNADLENARLRIVEGGSWKNQSIAVVIPAAATIPSRVALSHWNLIFPPNNGVVRVLAQGLEVGEAYSITIAGLLADPNISKFPYLLTIEHDNVPPPDGVLRLVKQMEAHPEFAAISGLYWTKGEGGVPQIWGDIKDPILNYRPQVPVPGALIECYGIGMGFGLWRFSMFKDEKLRKPWFRTRASKEEGVGTQDLYFCEDAWKNGYRFAVDCGCLVGHFDMNTNVCW